MLEQNHRVQINQAGAVAKAAATHQLFMSLNTDTDPMHSMDPDLQPNTHSEIAIPIMGMASGRPIGVLDIQSTQHDSFIEEDQRFLSLLAGQIGLAIENIHLHESIQQAAVEAKSPSPQQSHRGEWDRFTVEQQLIGYRYDISGTSPLTALITHSDRDSDKIRGEAAGFVGVPIELRGEVLGELLVQAPAGKRWTDDELDIIRAVAERVALSAENARLFEETNRRAERERMVSEITSKIRSTNDPNEMIKKAVQELKSALGVSRVEVRPQKSSNNTNFFEA
jgi:GAF domain-containing protein